MSDDGGGGDCGGGGGDSGGGDSGCTGGGDSGGGHSGGFSSNDGGCDSSHDVGTSHGNSSHSHTGDDHSSHANTHHNHSSTTHCLPTYEEAVGIDHHKSHNHDRHSTDDQVSTHCTTGNNRDDSNYDYQPQVNLLNSEHTTIDVYDQENNYDSSSVNGRRRNQTQPGDSKQRRRGPRKFITDCLMIAFGLIMTGLVVLLPLFGCC